MVMAVVDGDGAERLRAELQRALLELPAAELQVELGGGCLQIAGRVSSWHEKQRAQEILRRLCPGTQISNGARVDSREQEEAIVQL
jgi:osmotically-inducible protein OsmY